MRSSGGSPDHSVTLTIPEGNSYYNHQGYFIIGLSSMNIRVLRFATQVSSTFEDLLYRGGKKIICGHRGIKD